MRLVTAIFSKLYSTQFGGRLNRDLHYLYSIRTILKMGYETICYTSKEEYNWLSKELAAFSNLELRIYDLSQYRFHEKIQNIKLENQQEYDKDAVWTYRCVELMWLKMDWLISAAHGYDGNAYWIDAGLSHGGIIPSKFNPNYAGVEMAYEESFENIHAFNSNLGEKIEKLTGDKFFSFYCTNRQHKYPRAFPAPQIPGSIVAGLMGGTYEAVDLVYKAFAETINGVMDSNDLIQEEMVLTWIYQNQPELFNVVPFDTWYHEDWGCYNPDMKSFSAFFEGLR